MYPESHIHRDKKQNGGGQGLEEKKNWGGGVALNWEYIFSFER